MCDPLSPDSSLFSPYLPAPQHPGSSLRALPELSLGRGSTLHGASQCLLSQASPGFLCLGLGQIKAWLRALPENMTQEQLSWVLI